ncbi:GNAT family N-acetyltransferase [Planctomycetota bacterium]
MPIIPWKLNSATKADAATFMGVFRNGLENLMPIDYRHKNALAARTMIEEMTAVPKTAILIDRAPNSSESHGIVVIRNAPPILQILFLCVQSEVWRKGHGTQLVKAVQALGEKHGLSEIRIKYCPKDERAAEFVASAGFSVVGEAGEAARGFPLVEAALKLTAGAPD